jgi:hypothetical protein
MGQDSGSNLVVSAIGTPALHAGTKAGGTGTSTGTGAGKSVEIHTPAGERNITLNLIRPSIAVIVRAAWLFVFTLSGALGADQVGELIPAVAIALDFKTACIMAAGTTGLGALRDALTVLGELKNKYPLLSGGI